MSALRDSILINKKMTLLELSEQSNADDETKSLLKQIKEICAQNKFSNQQAILNRQTTQSLDADHQQQLYQNAYFVNGDIWNNVSLTSMNGTTSLSSTPKFSLSELFKPINTLTTTTASIATSSSTNSLPIPPCPPSTPNNQLILTPTLTSANLHSIKNSSKDFLINQQQPELNSLDDQVKLHMFTMSLDSPSSSCYLSSSNNSSNSPGSRFKINQVDRSNESNKFLRSNSINVETTNDDDSNQLNSSQFNRSAPINTNSSNRMMRSCSLGSWNSKYDKNERVSRSGRFSISPVVSNASPVPDNEMVSFFIHACFILLFFFLNHFRFLCLSVCVCFCCFPFFKKNFLFIHFTPN